MQDKNPSNLDDNLIIALALSKTINDKELNELEAENNIKKFLKKILKKIDQDQPLKKKQFKILNILLINAGKHVNAFNEFTAIILDILRNIISSITSQTIIKKNFALYFDILVNGLNFMGKLMKVVLDTTKKPGEYLPELEKQQGIMQKILANLLNGSSTTKLEKNNQLIDLIATTKAFENKSNLLRDNLTEANLSYFNKDEIMLNISLLTMDKKINFIAIFTDQFIKNQKLYDDLIYSITIFIKMLIQVESQTITSSLNEWFNLIFKQDQNHMNLIQDIINTLNVLASDKIISIYEIILKHLVENKTKNMDALLYLLRNLTQKVISNPVVLYEKGSMILNAISTNLSAIELQSNEISSLKFAEILQTIYDLFKIIIICATGQASTQPSQVQTEITTKPFAQELQINPCFNDFFDENEGSLDISRFINLDQSKLYSRLYCLIYSITILANANADAGLNNPNQVNEALICDINTSNQQQGSKLNTKDDKDKNKKTSIIELIDTNIFALLNAFLSKLFNLQQFIHSIDFHHVLNLLNLILEHINDDNTNNKTNDTIKSNNTDSTNAQANASAQANANVRIFKKQLIDLINIIFNNKIRYKDEFYKDIIIYLYDILINNSYYPQSNQYYIFIIRLIYVLLISKTYTTISQQIELETKGEESISSINSKNIMVLMKSILRRILNNKAKNIHPMIFFIFFKIMNNTDKNILFNIILDYTDHTLKSKPNMICIYMIYEILNIKDNQVSSLDLRIIEILNYNQQQSQLLGQPLSEDFVIENVKISKEMFIDCLVSTWITRQTQQKLLTLQKELINMQGNIYQNANKITEFIAIIAYLNTICKSITPDFKDMSYLDQLEQYKKNTENLNLFALLDTQKNLMSTIHDYKHFNPDQKHLFMLHNLAFSIKFNTLLHAHRSKMVNPAADAKQEGSLLLDYMTQLCKNIELVHSNVKGLTKQVISWLLNQANLPVNEEILTFCTSLHVFSRFSAYKPEKFFKKHLKASGIIMNLINFSRFYKENIQKEVGKYIELLHNNNTYTYFLKISALTIHPTKYLKTDINSAQVELARLCDQLILFILVLQESLQIFNSLLKMGNVEYKIDIPNDVLNNLFAICSENMMINNEGDNFVEEEIYNDYKIFEAAKIKTYKKEYTKLFFQIKKYSNIMNMIKIGENVIKQGGQNAIFVQKELLNVLNHLNKTELAVGAGIESKIAIMLLACLESGLNLTQLSEIYTIPEEFLAFTSNYLTITGYNLKQKFVNSIIHLIYTFNLKLPNLEKFQAKLENNSITKEQFSTKLNEKTSIVFIEFIKNLEPPKAISPEKADSNKPLEPMKADKLVPMAIKKSFHTRSTQKKDQAYFFESLGEAIASNKKSKKTTKQLLNPSKKTSSVIDNKKGKSLIKGSLPNLSESRDEYQALPVYELSYLMFIEVYSEIGRMIISSNKGDVSQLYQEKFITQRLLMPGYSLAYLKAIYSKKMEIEGALKLEEAYYISSRLERSYYIDFLKNILNKLQGRTILNLNYEQLAIRIVEILTYILQNLLESILKLFKGPTNEISLELTNTILGVYDLLNLMKVISNSNHEIRFNLFDNTLLLIFSFLNEIIPMKVDQVYKSLFDEFVFHVYSFATSFVPKPEINKEADYVKVPIEPIKEEPVDDNMVCTFAKTGKNHRMQHWYYCYTCNLTDRKGCCTVCAKVCHKGHDVVYSSNSNFFCDCGDGEGTEECISLKKANSKKEKKQGKQREKKTLETLHELFLSRKVPLEKMAEGFKGLPEEFFKAIEKQAEPLPLKFKNIEDYEGSSSNHELLEEEKSLGTYSENDSEKEDLQNFEDFSVIYQKIKPSQTIIPHRILENRFPSKYSTGIRIPSKLGGSILLSKSFNSKDKNNNSLDNQQKTLEISEEESINLTNIQDYIEERSIVSTNSYVLSPSRSKDTSILEEKKNVKENNTEIVMNIEKMKEIFTKFSKTSQTNKAKYNFVNSYVTNLSNIFDEYLSKNKISDKINEVGDNNSVISYLLSKSVDFSTIINAKLKQALESKISTTHKLLLGNIETKLRPDALGSIDKRLMGLLHLTNPPARKALDYNYMHFVAVTEGDKLYIFDKKTLLGLDGKLQPTDNKSRQTYQPGLFQAPGYGGNLYSNMPQPKTSLLAQGEDSQNQQFVLDKTKNLSKTSYNFAIFGVVFNKHFTNLLVIVGLYNLTAVTLDQNTGKVLSSTNIEIILDNDFILKAGWVPGRKSHIWIATLKSIRVFDLVQDVTVPVLFFSTLDAYIRDAEVIERPQNNDYRVIIASADGQLYTQLFDLEHKTIDNCEELIMVEAIVVPNEYRPINKPAIAIHYSNMCKMMFASYDDGNSLFGKFAEKECELINITRLNPYENKDKLSLFPSISKFGNIFTQHEDVYVDENCYIGCAIIRRSGQAGISNALGGGGFNNAGLAMLIKLTKENIFYQPIFNMANLKADSFTVIDNETQESRQAYVLVLMDDGTLQLNLVNQVDQTGIIKPPPIAVQEKITQVPNANQDSSLTKLLKEIEGYYLPNKLEEDGANQELIRAELISAKYPNLIIDFPEKSMPLEQSVLSVEDDLVKIMNGMNKFNRGYQFESIPSANEKNPINFTVGPKDKSFIIYGFRIRLTSSVSFKINIFNREISIPSKESERYIDIALSENEMIYGWLANKIKIVIPPLNKSINYSNQDLNFLIENAIKIMNFDIYGNKLDIWETEFKTETLQALKKKLEALKALEIQEENANGIESDNPILTTTLETIKSEKNETKLMKHLENLCALTSAGTFDIIDNDGKFLENLLNQLVDVLGFVQEPGLKIMAKTATKNLLNVIRLKQGIDQNKIILGHKLDYKTLKDFAAIRGIMNLLNNPQGLKLDNFGQIMFVLNKIQRKRGSQLQKIFTEFPDLMSRLVMVAFKLCKENPEFVEFPSKLNDFLNNEINYLTELLLLNHKHQKNQYLQAHNIDQAGITEKLLNDPDFISIGQENLKYLVELLCLFDKPLQGIYLKNVMNLIYLETASYQKEQETGKPGILEYATNIFIKDSDQIVNNETSALDMNQRITMMIEEEGRDLSDEEMMNLAIKMSLDEETRQKENSMSLEEGIPKAINFFRFDISNDLFLVLLQKIRTGITIGIEEYGAIFKLIYKLLKMHQILAFKAALPFNEKYINIFSNTLYDMMVKNELKTLGNINDITSKKLCSLINMANACLRSKENFQMNYKEETQARINAILSNKFSTTPPSISEKEKEKKRFSIESIPPTKSINLGLEFAKKFTQNIESLDTEKSGQLVNWIYQALEIFFSHFRSGNGTITANPQTGELNYKKANNASKVVKSDIGTIASLWSPIYRKSEVIKREGLVFSELDQDLFTGLLIFMSNLISYGFTLKNNNNSKWAELLSNIILTSPTSFLAQSFSKMLLNNVSGGKENSYKIKDKVLFSLEVGKILNLFTQTQEFKKLLTYDQYVTITQALSGIEAVATIRPENWASFCHMEPKITNILHLIILFNVEECCERSLKLLAIYYNLSSNEDCLKQENTNKDGIILSFDDKKVKNTSHWLDITPKYVDKYIDELLIESHSKKISTTVVDLLIGLWNVGNRDQKLYILNKVILKLEDVIGFGLNSENVFNLLGYMGRNIEWESHENLIQIRQQLSLKLMTIYDLIHENIVQHPNHIIYTTLQNLLRDQRSSFIMRYYFDTTACFRCYEGLNIPYNEYRLNDIKTELKYTHNCILVKLNNSMCINCIKLNIDDRHSYKQYKSLKTINIFINNKGVNDLVELKNNWVAWKKVMSQNIDKKRDKDEKLYVEIKFPLPITAKNLMIEFQSADILKSNYDNAVMICPNCLRKFDNRFGTGKCFNCSESSLECRKCGYFAEDKYDNLICSQCGASKYMTYDVMISARVGFSNEIIDSDKAKDNCEKNIANTLQKMNSASKEISEIRSKLQDLVSIYQGRDDLLPKDEMTTTLANKIIHNNTGNNANNNVGQTLIHDIVTTYNTHAREEYEKLMKMIGLIKSSRKAIQEYVSINQSAVSSSSSSIPIPPTSVSISDFNSQEKLRSNINCYGCLQNALKAYLNFYSNTENIKPFINTISEIRSNLPMNLLNHSVYDYSNDMFKYIKNGIVSINFAHFQNNKISYCQQTIDLFMDNIFKAIKTATTQNPIQSHELKIIQRQVAILVEICNKYQNELISFNTKPLETDSQLISNTREFWSKMLDKIYHIFYSVLDIEADLGLISELILCEILKYIRTLIKLAKTEEPSRQVKQEEIEDEDDEKLKRGDFIDESSENDSDKIEMIIEEEIKEFPVLSKKTTEICKDALSRLISKLLEKTQENDKLSSDNLININSVLESKRKYKLNENNWLTKCLTHHIDKVSQMAGLILKDLISEESFYLIYEVILSSYSKVHLKSRRSENFFNILKDFSINYLDFEKNPQVVKLTIKLINSIFIQVESDLRKLYEEYKAHLEGYTTLYMLNLKSGFEIRETLDMISNLIQNNQKLRNELKLEKNSLQYILNCFLIVRKFNFIKNHHIAEIEIKLNNMLDSLKPDSDADKKLFISECVSTLFIYDEYKDIISQAFLIEQILNIISPVKQRPDFMIDFKKIHSQEEFIKGVITKNPYRASDIGYTINDVRNKICKELEIGDPNPFELLVANNIVELDIPIHLVFEKVWIPYIKQREEDGHIPQGSPIPSMQVIFRIAGLDGEATENRITNLVDEIEDDKEQERKYRLTEVLLNSHKITLSNKQVAETSGVELILRKLNEIGTSSSLKNILKNIIKLLSLCAKLQPARKMIFKLKGVKILLELLLHYIPTYEENEKDSIVENILIILESVLTESEDEVDKTNEKMELEGDLDPQHSIENINLCMKRISKTGDKNDKSINNKILSALTKILPFLTNNLEQPSQVLLDYFKPHVYFNINQNEPKNNDERTYYINRFIEVLEILPSYYSVFRRLLRSEGIVIKVIGFIKLLLPDSKNLMNEIKTMENNQKNLSFCLKILVGLINGDVETQAYLKSEGVLDTIYKLSDPKVKVKDVGKYAESIIEHFLNPKHILDQSVASYIKDLKEAERQEKKRLAEKKRLETLKSMGAGKLVNPVVLQAQARDEAKKMEIEEEKILSCISCHEGYTYKPNDILGMYIYTKKHKISDEESWINQAPTSQEIQGIATVTHFNCIHLSCHNAAARAEKSMKKPKQEWEGAIIRNSHTKCNGWFPIKGPKTTQNEYETGLNKLYSSVESILKFGQDRIWIFLNDLKTLLTKFAKHETFSKETKGGAEEHNLKLIPYFIQLLIYLFKQKSDKLNQYHLILENFLKQNNQEKFMNAFANIEDFYLTLSIALIFVDAQTWNEQMKPALLFYIMNCGANMMKDINKQTLMTHNIKNKLILSPFFNIPRPNEKLSEFSLDQKNPNILDDVIKEDKPQIDMIDKTQAEKIDKFLDKILPLMILLKMSDEIINRIHAKVNRDNGGSSKGLNKGFIQELDQYLCAKYDEVIISCEGISKVYKEVILNLKSFEDFINCCNLRDLVVKDFKGLDTFVNIYIA